MGIISYIVIIAHLSAAPIHQAAQRIERDIRTVRQNYLHLVSRRHLDFRVLDCGEKASPV